MADMVVVITKEQIAKVADLAREIWVNHYVPIVGQAQVDYMLEQFQSITPITAQIVDGYDYYLLLDDGEAVGYLGVVPCPEKGQVQISKAYLKMEKRGQGLGRVMFRFVETVYGAKGMTVLWLTVNRHNSGSIAFYEHLGYVKEGTLVQDIGNGFVMDDYRMMKRLPFTPKDD